MIVVIHYTLSNLPFSLIIENKGVGRCHTEKELGDFIYEEGYVSARTKGDKNLSMFSVTRGTFNLVL